MADDLVTIASFGISTDAHLARLRLEAAGIECFLDNEYMVDANWLWSGAVGGVKVKVARSHAEDAVGVLQIPFAKDPDAEPPAALAPPCPKCGCTRMIYQRISPRKAVLSLLLLGFPLPFIKPTFKCKQCRREGRSSRSRQPPRTSRRMNENLSRILAGRSVKAGGGHALRLW